MSGFITHVCPIHGPQYIGDLDNRTTEDPYACGEDIVVDGLMDLCPVRLVARVADVRPDEYGEFVDAHHTMPPSTWMDRFGVEADKAARELRDCAHRWDEVESDLRLLPIEERDRAWADMREVVIPALHDSLERLRVQTTQLDGLVEILDKNP